MVKPRVIELLPVEFIDVGKDRLRPLDQARVKSLKETLSDPKSPPLLPIEVCKKPGANTWTLLDGLHRLTAFRDSGRSQIEAIIHNNDTITARMVELHRNLFVGDLTSLAKAKHIAELYYLERAKRGLAPTDDPRKLGGRPKKTFQQAEAETSALSAEVSLSGALRASIGLKERQIRKYLAAYRSLSPEALGKIEANNIDLPGAQLMLLAKQAPADQDSIVERMLIPADHPDPKELARRVRTVSAALKNSAQKQRESKDLSVFLSSFRRLTLTDEDQRAIGTPFVG